MSYVNGTTHYGLPQTVGTDKRDWFDTNQAFADIDEAIYGAVQQSSSTATALTALTTRVGSVESDVATIQSSQSTDEANIAALQTLVNQHTSEIADVKADALDMICAVDEGTAQVASVAVSEGDYFRYNDVLYIATTDIAVGDTIVPNTNCRATNVATELEASSVSIIVNGNTIGYARRINKIVTVNFRCGTGESVPSGTIFTLPSGYRPPIRLAESTRAVDAVAGGVPIEAPFEISNTGEIINWYSSAVNSFGINVTYIID